MNRRSLNLPTELSNAIREYYFACRTPHNDKNYQAKFAATGARKAQPVLDYVRERYPDLARLVYVSIGGADGSEIAAVLQGTPIAHGILLEFSDEGATQARIHAANLAERGKRLVVLQGDATQRLEDCCARLRELRSNGISGIVCSAQAVLHELPFRSPSFRPSHFFGRLFHGFDTRFFYSREPAALHSWPETVQIRFGGTPPIPSAVVAALARLIVNHFGLPGEVHEVVDNYVELSRAAAGEVLRKILYFADQNHFVYEMGECHERFDADKAAKVIGASVGNRPLEVQRLNSDTFSLRYDQLRVEARHPDGSALQQPAAFALLRGFTAPTVAAAARNGEAPRLLPPALSGVQFTPETFDGDITEEEYRKWLSQFQPGDQPFAEKLAAAFRYYSLRRMNAVLRRLYTLILQGVGVPEDRLRFIPVGYVAKSGSVIAYFFRKQNKLKEDRFLASNDVAVFERDPSLVPVLIDDFIGSGHQSRQVIAELRRAAPHFAGRVVFAAAVGLESGIDALRQDARVLAIAADIVKNSELPFADPSPIFPDPEDRAVALEFVERCGIRLYPQHPLGYARSQGLIGFFYSTPNNTLPIFWSSDDGWSPLLPHGESFRDPSYLFGPPTGLTEILARGGPAKPLIERVELDKYDVPEDMAVRIFGEFHKAAIFLVIAPILRDFGMTNAGFSSLLTAVAKLKQLEHEQHSVCSTLLITRNADDLEAHGIPVGTAAPGFTLDASDELSTFVQLVNGLEGAVVVRPDGGITGAVLFPNNGSGVDRFIPPRYHPAALASAASDALCFLFLGNGRIHVFYRGQRILSHRNAAWHLQLSDFRPGLAALAAERGISAPALETVMRLAVLLADSGRGALLTVGDHEAVLSLSDPPAISHICVAPFTLGVGPDERATGLMLRDGATIVSSDGVLVRAMAFLRPPAGTEGEEEVGRGARHSTAAKISRATRCLALAVSVDGRITVYANGFVRLKVMG
jgi:hypothetical protein